MTYHHLPIIVLLTLILGGCGSTENEQKTQEYTLKLDSLLQTTVPRKFNGVVLVTKDGEVKYSRAHGYSDFDKMTPISADDRFRIQSNSKQITAILVLREVEKGNINLEETIRHYLPDFQTSWADTVTIHQLLNMSAGLIALDQPLAFEPGTGFRYSNPAYGLLGRILQKTTGKSYPELAESLFDELGMSNTYCYEISGSNDGLIPGYWVSNDSTEAVFFDEMNFTEESWAGFIPAGGIISTPSDLNIWDTKLHSGEILEPSTYQMMVNSEVVDSDFTFSDQNSNYGYGVNINEEGPFKYIGHAGRGIGFVNLKIYVPSKNLDLIIMENVYNQDGGIVYHFEKEIRKIVLSSSLVQ